MEEILSGEDPKVGQTPKKTQKRAKKVAPAAISSSKPSNGSNGTDPPVPDPIDQCTLDGVVDYARRFPVKSIKKAVRIEESLVCAIRCGDVFLIQKRPSKGLLAGLWELPSFAIPEPGKSTALSRRRMAQSCISDLLSSKGKKGKKGKKEEKAGVKYAGELGSVPWLFSHIKLTMHVHLFELEEPVDGLPLITKSRWATSKDIENESMGTGMRKCWAMVRLSGR
jgi:A/G-specific adenine glycosylase